MRYFMGDGMVGRCFGESRLHEKTRRRGLGTAQRDKDSWWRSHAALPPEIEATGEDAMYAQLQFRSGAVGQWVMDRRGHGLPQDRGVIYGSSGSIEAPRRSQRADPSDCISTTAAQSQTSASSITRRRIG
jgi:hypothetical protein